MINNLDNVDQADPDWGEIIDKTKEFNINHHLIYLINTVLSTYIKLLSICLVSSDDREFAKLINEQYTAAQAHHFIWIEREIHLKNVLITVKLLTINKI